jgi:hypothetical protein
MDLTKIAKKTISECLYLNIASITPSGSPWNTPVYYTFDNNFNLYWYSDKNSIHSENIRNNQEIFITIYMPDEKSPGIYIEAIAFELSTEEEISNLSMRDNTKYDPKEFLRESPLRMYKAIPSKVSISTPETANKYKEWWVDKRIEIMLD